MRTLGEHNERAYTAPRCRARPIQSVVVNQSPWLESCQHGKMRLMVLENSQCRCCYYRLHLGIHFTRSHVICCLRRFLDLNVACGGIEKQRGNEDSRGGGVREDSEEDSEDNGKDRRATRKPGGDKELSKLTHVDLHSPVNKLILHK